MTTRPLYPFGHGLSYTTFVHDNLQITPTESQAGDMIQVRCDLTNSGERGGKEIVQLFYVHDPIASVKRQVKSLKGFKRVQPEPGQKATITFDLDVRHLAFYDREMQYISEPGTIEVMIGSSSAEIRLSGTFEIVSETRDVKPVYETRVSVTGR